MPILNTASRGNKTATQAFIYKTKKDLQELGKLDSEECTLMVDK